MILNKTNLLVVSILLSSIFCNAQESSLKLTSQMGEYAVGFKSIDTYDYSRSFLPTDGSETKKGEVVFRPMQISIWYPAKSNAESRKIKYEDYFYLQLLETGAVDLTTDNKKKFVEKFIKLEPVVMDKFDKELSVEMNAIKNASEANGSFPVIVYGPSYSSTSIENALMFELLASHGYVVISSPSIGPYTRSMGGGQLGIETQARDLEFLISEARSIPNADINKLALMGFSWGGLSSVYTMARNLYIDAWIGLDPSIHEAYSAFEESNYNNYSSFSSPSLFFHSLGFTGEAPFYDKLIYSNAYMVNLPKIGHTDLASQFIKLFSDGGETRNKAYNIVCNYTLLFLDGVFKKELDYNTMTEKVFNQTKVDTTFMSIKSKKALPKPKVLFEKYKNKNLMAFLNSKNVIGRYPKEAIQELIVLLYENNFKNKANDLMKWFTKEYDVDSYTKVLSFTSIDETVEMFVEVYNNNDENCSFSYSELNHTAQLFSMGNRKREAIKYFDLNIKLRPDSYEAYFNSGTGYFRLNDFVNAKKHFTKCLNLNPDERFSNLAKSFLEKSN